MMDSNKDLEKVLEGTKEKFFRARRWVASKSSTSYFILGSYNVVLLPEDAGIDVAAVDMNTLYLTPKWGKYTKKDRCLILLHEINHILMRHQWRNERFISEHPDKDMAWRFAKESKVNWAIMSMDKAWRVSGWVEPTDWATPDDLNKLSAEKLAIKIHEEKGDKLPQSCDGIDLVIDCESDDGNSGNGKGKIGRDGKLKLNVKGLTIEEGDGVPQNENQLIEKIKDAIVSSKIAGNELSNVESRILGQLTKSKVNWKTELRMFFNNTFGRNVIGTWKRMNRRGLNLPARQMISKPRVWNFIDISGSINIDEYRQFCSEIKKQSDYIDEARFITWDTEVKFDKKFKKFSDVKVEFRGGGGTSFEPIWKQYHNQIQPNDIVVVFTDGYWAEDDDWFPRHIAKTLMITTGKERKGFDKVITINGEDDD